MAFTPFQGGLSRFSSFFIPFETMAVLLVLLGCLIFGRHEKKKGGNQTGFSFLGSGLACSPAEYVAEMARACLISNGPPTMFAFTSLRARGVCTHFAVAKLPVERYGASGNGVCLPERENRLMISELITPTEANKFGNGRIFLCSIML